MSTLKAIAIIVGVLSGVAGVAGFFLGIANYIHQRDTTRPRIVVRPHAFGTDTPRGRGGLMEVRNVGQVPVVGWAIGFLRARGAGHGFLFCNAESINGIKWTDEELKPQHVALLRFNLEEVPQGTRLGRAYAETVVGDKFKASRRDMRRFAKQRKAAST
jgi:hypothetical protein